jgi:integrase
MKGTTYKRCPCPPRYNDAGKRLTCPKKHGAWAFTLAVPLTDDGRKTFGRPQVTRSGFGLQDVAESELRRVIQLLEIPEADDDASRMQIVALIRDSYRQSGQLPDAGDVRRKFLAGVPLVANQTTAEWFDEWLASKRGLARNTHRCYEGHIRLHLMPHLGQVPLAKLRRAHVRAAYDAILAGNADRKRAVGPATIERIHATLRKSLNDAVKDGRLTDNPALHVELEPVKRPKPVVWTRGRILHWMKTGERPKVAVWTPVQTGWFLDYAADDRLYAYYHLLVFRGPRRGEGIGLRWPNLDLDAATMDISEQIIQVGYETEVAPTKADSDGLVALDALTVAALRGHQRQQAVEAGEWGDAWSDTGYVFTTESGESVHPDYVSRHFARLVERANQIKLGDTGPAVTDVQACLGVAVTGTYDKATRLAVYRFQSPCGGLIVNGIVDPQTWFRLFPDSPWRDYPHPGYLPPIRLHDLRHLAATLALAAGVEMKVVSAMLRHKTLAITADTYTSVLPEVARAAAEAASRIVPRQAVPDSASDAASISLASGAKKRGKRVRFRTKAQVKGRGAGGARTHDRQIMSPLL